MAITSTLVLSVCVGEGKQGKDEHTMSTQFPVRIGNVCETVMEVIVCVCVCVYVCVFVSLVS